MAIGVNAPIANSRLQSDTSDGEISTDQLIMIQYTQRFKLLFPKHKLDCRVLKELYLKFFKKQTIFKTKI